MKEKKPLSRTYHILCIFQAIWASAAGPTGGSEASAQQQGGEETPGESQGRM